LRINYDSWIDYHIIVTKESLNEGGLELELTGTNKQSTELYKRELIIKVSQILIQRKHYSLFIVSETFARMTIAPIGESRDVL
jgi:hypothetical protein